MSSSTHAPLLPPGQIDRLRGALSDYTVDGVYTVLGPVGQAALTRGDHAGARRQLQSPDPLSTLIRLFLLGDVVDEAAARRALHPLEWGEAAAAGIVSDSAGAARALLDIRPYAEAVPVLPLPGAAPAGEPPWWVVSDFGADVHPGPLADDHVLGIGAAALTLAQATIRQPVGSALDIGTGCGVQALHLSNHATAVTATDISARALRLAATTAELSGVSWELRRGSLLEPVAGQTFDLIVANPPFVVSPGLRAGAGGYDYRDSGFVGDEVCRVLVGGLPAALAPGGVAQLLANWIIPTDAPWTERLESWLAGGGCDAWVWQREVVDPGEYIALWLRDAGESPGTDRYVRRYDEWADWMADAGVAAVGMGLVTLWRTDAAQPTVICEDVPQPLEQPVGAHVARWHARRRWLAGISDAALLDSALRCADGVVLDRQQLRDASGWRTAASTLRQAYGLRWEVEVDEAVATLLAGCDGALPLRVPVGLLAASLEAPAADVARALVPVVRDLVGRGFLEPGGPR
ncbi:MAG: hypothetical protein QOH14_619 [Pseudonocardiales bacterium]|nr:hypothetical protein [Pseudonocardiales bacterium]